MRRHGADEATILQAVMAHNCQHCDPPLSEREVKQIAQSIAKYPANAKAKLTETPNGRCLQQQFVSGPTEQEALEGSLELPVQLHGSPDSAEQPVPI